MRSATTEQKPDIVMHIHKNGRDITLTYLYEAKYSVRGDDDATLGNVQDEPKPETINAMHHYRDAIYYGKRGERRFSKEMIGGYILFPGRMDEHRLLEQIQSHNEQRVKWGLTKMDKARFFQNIGSCGIKMNLKNWSHAVFSKNSCNFAVA